MPMSKTRRGRLHQVAHWLKAEFPAPYPVTVQVLRIGPQRRERAGRDDKGETVRLGRRIYVRVDSRLKWGEAIDTLLHEWAHAASWTLDAAEQRLPSTHPDEFWLMYGRIYRAYYEENGWRKSRDYPVPSRYTRSRV